MLQFELTPDVRVPLETKKANQVLLRVSKLVNKKTGQVAYKVQKVKKLDYEFECEVLADFAFGQSNAKETKEIIKEMALEKHNESQDEKEE